MSYKVETIHKSNLYGTIVECGAGAIIAQKLYEVDGSSKTVYNSSQPYSKEIQEQFYGKSYERSVSVEFIDAVFNEEQDLMFSIKNAINPNFVLVTTFQIGNEENKKITHGYIGVMYKGEKKIYHITIPENLSRVQYIHKIGNIGIDILYSLSYNESLFPFFNQYVDNIYVTNSEGSFESKMSETLLSNFYSSEEQDNLIFINKEGKIERLEEFMRTTKKVIIYKGSFNPMHHGHKKTLEITEKMFPDALVALNISISNFDKPRLPHPDLIERIRALKGYNIIINFKPLFVDLFFLLKKRYTETEFIFPMGMDTINRVIGERMKVYSAKYNTNFHEALEKDFENIDLVVYDRQQQTMYSESKYFGKHIIVSDTYTDDGISSTQIRNEKIKV